MSWFANLKVFNKLMVLTAVVAAALFTVSFAGYYYSKAMYEQAQDMYKNRLIPIQQLGEINRLSALIEARTYEIMTTPDKAQEQKLMEQVKQYNEQMDKQFTGYENSKLDPYEVERVKEYKGIVPVYRPERQKAVDMALAGQKQEGYAYFKQNAAKYRDRAEVLRNELAEYNGKVAEEMQVQIEREYLMAVRMMTGVAVSALILCVLLGIAIARRISQPLAKLQGLMEQAGKGNLTLRGEVTSADEIGQVTGAFNKMIQSQHDVVGMVQKAAVELAAASEEMAASSEQVTSTSEQVAKSISTVAEHAEGSSKSTVETSEVLLQLSSLIQMARRSAQSAEKTSQDTLRAAEEGQVTVADAVSRMDNIKNNSVYTEQLITTLDEYSKQIGIITDTITSIANQTNLLALNAAIEAARAGEAGRGFAVVAEEVRKLAEDSNAGAGEVAALVRKVAESTEAAVTSTQKSRLEAEQGVVAVHKAGESLERIVAAVKGTVHEVTSIADITKDEVATSDIIVNLINNVASGVETMAAEAEEVAAATEQTTATMQTVAASAEETSAMAHDLKRVAEQFTI